MPINFDKFSNHSSNNNENYDLIIFGQFAEVLEVELNELQQIFNSKFINKFITEGNGVLVNLSNKLNLQSSADNVSWSDVDINSGYINSNSYYRLTATGDIPVLIDGMVFRIPTNAAILTSKNTTSSPLQASIVINNSIQELYLNYSIKDISDGYVIKRYGWVGEGSESINTEIIDRREGEETSRRRIVIFNITKSTPDNTNFTTSKLINTDYRYINSNDSQKYIIDNLLNLLYSVDDIRKKYVRIDKFESYLPEATESKKGIVRYATDQEVATTSGDGVVRAGQLKNGLIPQDVINLVYPIGSIYMTVNGINPSTLFTGTSWERLPLGYYLTNGTLNGEPRYSVNDNHNTIINRSNLPSITLTGSGSTSHNGAHNHRVDDHAHYVPEHKHIVPWGENWGANYARFYPWGSPARELGAWQNGRPTNFCGMGSGSTDFDNEWMFTSPVGLWTHGSSPWTNHSGGHSHVFSFSTEVLGNGIPLNVNLRTISVILWKRVR